MVQQALRRPGRIPRTAMQQALQTLWDQSSTNKPYRRITALVTGDSFSVGNAAVGTSLARGMGSRGSSSWLVGLSRRRIAVTRLVGLGGINTTDYIASYLATALAGSEELVLLDLGVNNCRIAPNAVPEATTRAEYIQIWTAFRDAGKKVLQRLIPPTSHANWNGQSGLIRSLNQFIIDFAAQNSSWFHYSDTFNNRRDPTSTTYAPLSRAVDPDLLHLNSYGAYLNGEADLVGIGEDWLGGPVADIRNNANTPLGNPSGYTQLLQNPILEGITGTLTPGTGTITGVVPAGWTLQNVAGAAVVNSAVGVDSNGIPFVRVSGTVASGGAQIILTSENLAAHAGMAAGLVTSVSGKVRQIKNVNATFNLMERRSIASTDYDIHALNNADFTYPPGETQEMYFETVRTPVESGSRAIVTARFAIFVTGSGEFDFIFKQIQYHKHS